MTAPAGTPPPPLNELALHRTAVEHACCPGWWEPSHVYRPHPDRTRERTAPGCVLRPGARRADGTGATHAHVTQSAHPVALRRGIHPTVDVHRETCGQAVLLAQPVARPRRAGAQSHGMNS